MIHDLQQLNGEQDLADYLLSGHIHPAVKLRGKARQSMKLPCFYFGKQQGVLPAFGHFTGTHVIKPQPDDRVYAIVNQRVVPIKTAR
ncbi:MAG: hypothetical protein R3211_07370 [Balneolaceae bacterium]|nr:hypothetical protein [Balneolaceae bacterium]